MSVRLSFILPCYNVGRFITDTLRSLYAQGMPEDEFEVICVNDCSTDDTHDRIAAFSDNHSNLILLDQPRNMYSGAARNRGLDIAQGDYIWFVDSDDLVKPAVAPRLLEMALSFNLDLLLFNYDEFLDEHPEDIHPAKDIFKDTEVMDGGMFVHECFGDRLTRLSLLWLRLFRRGLIEENGIRFPDLYISQDCPFAWETLLLSKRVKAISEHCYLYRSSAGSITANKNTAKKAAVWSFQFPYELERLQNTVDGKVPVGIVREISRNMCHEVNQFARRYNLLPGTEKSAYYQAMHSDREWFQKFKSKLTRRNRLIYRSGFWGERVFALFAKRFTKD
ncbi:MAG: glycosyltransferase [Bacteroidales bacterium]|nr:glycosyltransferase [Bacteroidales bacterium]